MVGLLVGADVPGDGSAGLRRRRPATKSFTYKKTKQADLEMIVHYPPGWKETDKRPAIVFFFGGGWTNGNVKQFESQATHLASRGMVPPGPTTG